MKVNEKIRLLRESRQWSQEDMASKLSMSTKGYAKIERGETRSNLPRLEQISEIFDIDIFELLSYGEEGKVFINNADNNLSYSSISFSNSEVENENQRLRLMLSHKDEIIEMQKKELVLLQELVEALRNKEIVAK